MSYMTWEMLANKYPGAGAKFGNSPEVAMAFLPGAEGEINGRCAARYTVPFSPVPPLIQDICVDLVYVKLVIRDPKLSKAVKDYVDQRLDAIADGTLAVVLVDGTVLSDGANGAVIDKEYHSVFGPDAAENWQPDTDALDDAEDSRDGD